MREEVINYLKKERTCVLAVEMPDGSPHAATVHYVHTLDPFQIVFLTEKGYKKAQPFMEKTDVRSAVVIGTQEQEMKSIQLNGTAKVTQDQDLIDAYYHKFQEKDKKNLTSEDVFLLFTPSWWRFTDWTLPEGKTIFESDGKVFLADKR